MTIPAAVIGLGPIGRRIARAVWESREFDLVAIVDVNPELIGRRLADVIGVEDPGIAVTADAGAAFVRAEGGIVFQATGSRLSSVVSDVLSAVRCGASVISTCPELAFPWLDDPDTAAILDGAAQASGTVILGTGVNPGFAMDRLAVCAGQVSGAFRHVRVNRSVDIANRRRALLLKAGVGLGESEFRVRAAGGSVGHLGLRQSAALVARGLGIGFTTIEEDLEAVIAERAWDGSIPMAPGTAAGYLQTARVLQGGLEVLRLELTYALGAENRDTILIDADPSLHLEIRGGVSGDAATVWSVMNAAPRIRRVGAGLLTVLDLPLRTPGAWGDSPHRSESAT
jgi:2,4-diaminopentanoate dehydrogenase